VTYKGPSENLGVTTPRPGGDRRSPIEIDDLKPVLVKGELVKHKGEILRRGDLKDLFTEHFYYWYEIWEIFHFMKMLPYGKGPIHENYFTMKILMEFEREVPKNWQTV
jgi:hypothetical protein